MSYTDGEALLLAKVQASTVYTSETATRGSWRVLNSGEADHYAILRPGEFTRTYGAGIMVNLWSTVIELWQRYIDDGSSMTALQADAETLVDYLDKSRTLDDTTNTIVDATVKDGREVEEMWMKNADGPSWLRWQIRVVWQEEVTVAYTD